jgi:hypothetical protein
MCFIMTSKILLRCWAKSTDRGIDGYFENYMRNCITLVQADATILTPES